MISQSVTPNSCKGLMLITPCQVNLSFKAPLKLNIKLEYFDLIKFCLLLKT